MIMKNTVTDELVNKLYHLTKALNLVESIVEKLQQENLKLKETLSYLEHSEDKELVSV